MSDRKERPAIVTAILYVVFFSTTIVVFLVAGIWAVGQAVTHDSLTFEDGVRFMETYRTLPDAPARELYLRAYTASRTPLFRFSAVSASSPECALIRERAFSYMDRAAELLRNALPTDDRRPLHLLLLDLDPQLFVEYHAYSSAGLTMIEQHVKRCSR